MKNIAAAYSLQGERKTNCMERQCKHNGKTTFKNKTSNIENDTNKPPLLVPVNENLHVLTALSSWKNNAFGADFSPPFEPPSHRQYQTSYRSYNFETYCTTGAIYTTKAQVRLDRAWAEYEAAVFTSLNWTRLESGVRHQHPSERSICLLPFQTIALFQTANDTRWNASLTQTYYFI